MKYYISHSAKGSTWAKHKYIKKIGDRYIYAKDQVTSAANNLKSSITSAYEKGKNRLSSTLGKIGNTRTRELHPAFYLKEENGKTHFLVKKDTTYVLEGDTLRKKVQSSTLYKNPIGPTQPKEPVDYGKSIGPKLPNIKSDRYHTDKRTGTRTREIEVGNSPSRGALSENLRGQNKRYEYRPTARTSSTNKRSSMKYSKPIGPTRPTTQTRRKTRSEEYQEELRRNRRRNRYA